MAEQKQTQKQTQMVKADAGVTNLQTFLNARRKHLMVYAARKIDPDTLIRLALLDFSQNEWLRRVRPESIYGSLIAAAQLGLEIGSVKGEAYLVPFKSECVLVPGYRGLHKLALRSKGVKSIDTQLVYENDSFSIDLGSDPKVVHHPTLDDDAGDIRGVYAVAHLATGGITVEWMRRVEIDRIRDMSQGARRGREDAPWVAHYGEMARKTVLRRIAKRLPLGDDFYAASAIDESVDAGKDPPKLNIDVTDAEVVETTGGLRDKVKAAAGEPS